MGKLTTKSTNSHPIFYDVSSNHHQNLVNLCLMMNPPLLVVHSHPAPPRHPFFTVQEAQSLPGRMLRAPTCHRGIQTQPAREKTIAYQTAPWKIPRLEKTQFGHGGGFFQMIFFEKWVDFYGFHLKCLGGTYPTWQVGSWFSSVSSVSSVVPGGVIGLTLEVHQEQSIDPRNKKEEVHLSDASQAVFFGGQEFWTHPTWLGRSKHDMGLHHTFDSKGLSKKAPTWLCL